MATTKSSTIKRYNGTDYDTINPITTGQNVYGSGANSTTPLLNSNDKIDSVFLPTFTDTNYYPIRSYTSGLQISSYSGSTNCQLYVPNASSSQAGVVSTSAQTFAGVKSFRNGIKLFENDSYYATVQGSSSSYIDITLTLPSSSGVLALVSDIPEGDVDVTINGTATSTVEALSNIVVGTTTYKNLTTFTGTSTTTGTPSGTTTVPTSYHLHDITLSGTRTTSGSGTTARRTLAITGSSSATSSTISVASSGHNHTFTAQGSLS